MQLIGRLWRKPQQKRVIIYRLIGLESPDEYLMNISWGKGAMHESFFAREAISKPPTLNNMLLTE